MYKANEGVIRKTGKSYTFVNADGSTNEAEEVFIDWIKIGGIELQNVRAVLKQKGDNLLGQNVLGKLNFRTLSLYTYAASSGEYTQKRFKKKITLIS